MLSLKTADRNAISTALGIAPNDTAISQLALLLGGLSAVTTRKASIAIALPPNRARADISAAFHHLPHLKIGGDAAKVIVKRGEAPNEGSLQTISLPPTTSQPLLQKSSLKNEAGRTPLTAGRRAQPAATGRLGMTRATQVATALGVSPTELPDYPTVVGKLEEASSCAYHRSKNGRADGVLFISVASQGDATSLLQGLGFASGERKGQSVWGGVTYRRICPQTETMSSASVALSPAGCDITIGVGEPLTMPASITSYTTGMPATPPEE